MFQVPASVARGLYAVRPDATDRDDWRDEAACLGTDTDSFYPTKGEEARVAKKICRRCRVKSQCLNYAIEMNDPNGIWGGLGEGERRRLLRAA